MPSEDSVSRARGNVRSPGPQSTARGRRARGRERRRARRAREARKRARRRAACVAAPSSRLVRRGARAPAPPAKRRPGPRPVRPAWEGHRWRGGSQWRETRANRATGSPTPHRPQRATAQLAQLTCATRSRGGGRRRGRSYRPRSRTAPLVRGVAEAFPVALAELTLEAVPAKRRITQAKRLAAIAFFEDAPQTTFDERAKRRSALRREVFRGSQEGVRNIDRRLHMAKPYQLSNTYG